MIISDDTVKEDIMTKLCSRSFVTKHKDELLDLFPSTYTHIRNIDLDTFHIKLQKLGINIETQLHFDSVLFTLKTIKIYLEDPQNAWLIIRNSNFDPSKYIV
jgi:hypothetical protein